MQIQGNTLTASTDCRATVEPPAYISAGWGQKQCRTLFRGREEKKWTKELREGKSDGGQTKWKTDTERAISHGGTLSQKTSAALLSACLITPFHLCCFVMDIRKCVIIWGNACKQQYEWKSTSSKSYFMTESSWCADDPLTPRGRLLQVRWRQKIRIMTEYINNQNPRNRIDFFKLMSIDMKREFTRKDNYTVSNEVEN